MFTRSLLKTASPMLQRQTMAAPARSMQAVSPLLAAQMQMSSASFSVKMNKNTSGIKRPTFDYYSDSKLERGNFPHKYHSFMKVLGEDYDTSSPQHLENLEKMKQINMDLMENVSWTMKISKEEELKLIKRGKFDARDRIRKLIDRGSPFLALG